MKRPAMFSCAAAICCFLGPAVAASAVAAAAEPAARMMGHDVYFSLIDGSPAARAKLVADCKKYLADHPGLIWFSAGTLAAENQRDVNDRDFDVAIHLVFKDKAAQDQYQKAARHLKFIAENKANWKKVRVFDWYIDATWYPTTKVERPGSSPDVESYRASCRLCDRR